MIVGFANAAGADPAVPPATFRRRRPDKPPAECRDDQLEVTPPYELEKVFGAVRRS